MTEYGFQSFPEMRTVETFTIPEDRINIFTPVMLAHQKNNAGNSIIHDYMLRDYPQPKDFASFLYASQVLQAEGIKIGAEHLRRNRPRTMGSIYWQLNDCWPVASWSSLDYYGRWKALHYYARRFYAPLLVSPHQEERQRRGLRRLRQDIADGSHAACAHPDLRRRSAERQVAARHDRSAVQQGVPHHADARHHQPAQL